MMRSESPLPSPDPSDPASGPPSCRFGSLIIEWGDGVLVPRAWTLAHSSWAVELASVVPDGPVLELCTGCGHIGLEVVARTGREAVLVDASSAACRWARRNARTNGLGALVEVRHAPIEAALAAGERFPLIVADPPYLPSGEIGLYPDDPRLAIDGGADGLAVMRVVLDIIAAHLAVDGVALVQVRGAGQAAQVRALVQDGHPDLRVGAVRAHDDERAVIELRPSAD
jgi:methylase of polypeptide subunit release factors